MLRGPNGEDVVTARNDDLGDNLEERIIQLSDNFDQLQERMHEIKQHLLKRRHAPEEGTGRQEATAPKQATRWCSERLGVLAELRSKIEELPINYLPKEEVWCMFAGSRDEGGQQMPVLKWDVENKLVPEEMVNTDNIGWTGRAMANMYNTEIRKYPGFTKDMLLMCPLMERWDKERVDHLLDVRYALDFGGRNKGWDQEDLWSLFAGVDPNTGKIVLRLYLYLFKIIFLSCKLFSN